MSDPLDVLRAPAPPVAPDPAFARRLRARVEQALGLTRGAPMSTTSLEPRTEITPVTGVVPYLAVADARRALDWYVEVLGARRVGDPIVMPDGRIGHAELDVAGGLVMMSDEYREIGVGAPQPGAAASVTLHAEVPDVDALTARAVRAGAVLEREPADHPYGRNAVIRDPFGHRWMLASSVPTPTATATANPRHGDIGYVSLWVPDVDRAARFFGEVLGWRYEPDHGGRGRRVVGQTLHHGMWGGEPEHTLYLCVAVDDLDAATERVRDAGGTAGSVSDEPYGRVVDCTDDQGMRFSLYQPPAGPAERGPENGERHGDVSYLTIEVVDSARFRSFFASVLGWEFRPGRVEDGWQVADVVPMVGLQGGHDRPTVVPMYRVDDIDDAVVRVRTAGGGATEPERQPYGTTSTCVDDQGTRFYLGTL